MSKPKPVHVQRSQTAEQPVTVVQHISMSSPLTPAERSAVLYRLGEDARTDREAAEDLTWAAGTVETKMRSQLTAAFKAPAEPTIWSHGERNYSMDGRTPYLVTVRLDNILAAFRDGRRAMDTKALEKNSSLENVAKYFTELMNFQGGLFREALRPASGGGGYYAHVRPISERI